VREKGLSGEDVTELRHATAGKTIFCIAEAPTPVAAEGLFKAVIEPVIAMIRNSGCATLFQNELVTQMTHDSPGMPFSNYAMHLAPGGQDGVHCHPFGERNLYVYSADHWMLLCGRSPEPGEDPAGIKKIARVALPPGQFLVNLPANTPHGFESMGRTVAFSIHRGDEKELRQAAEKQVPIQDGDVMSTLTRDLGSEGLEIIGKTDVPYKVILDLAQTVLH
jgi:hypothetical protein